MPTAWEETVVASAAEVDDPPDAPDVKVRSYGRHNKVFLGPNDAIVFLRRLQSFGLELVGDMRGIKIRGRGMVHAVVCRRGTREAAGERWGWFDTKAQRWVIVKERPTS